MDSPNPASDGSVVEVEPRVTRRRAAKSATASAPATTDADDTDTQGGTAANSDDDGDDYSGPSTSTPRGRGRPRGRPRGSGRGRGRGRGRDKGLSYNPRISELRRVPTDGAGIDDPDSSTPSTMMVDKKEYTFQFDELQLPDDPKGDLKIDAKGNLLGGREFKARTFTSPYRADPEKVYMLSIDAARTCGYRDSLYFFRRNKELVKLSLANKEKDILIRDRRLNGTFKARSVTMIAVRNAFKLQGAKMIKDGRHVTDDYYEPAALARCAEEGFEPGSLLGDLPDPMSLVESRNLNLSSAVASHRVAPNQPFYTPGGPTTHFPAVGQEPFVEAKGVAKRLTLAKAGFSQENWLARFASEASEKNAEMTRQRRERLQEVRQGFMWDGAEAPEVDGQQMLLPLLPPPAAATAKGTPVADDGPSAKGKEHEGSVASTALTAATATTGLAGGLLSRAVSTQPAPAPAALARPKAKRPRTVGPPLGVYEPETHIPQVHVSSQPTTAAFERIAPVPSYAPFDPSLPGLNPDPQAPTAEFAHLSALGGNGQDSWGLASVRYELDVDGTEVWPKGVVLGNQ